MDDARNRALETVAACSAGGPLVAAADSALYPHVWARDVGIASLGICAAGDDRGLSALMVSLTLLAKHQSTHGRIPLKVDATLDRPVTENSAGVDSGLWFAIAVHAVSALVPREDLKPLVESAIRAVDWAAHLDVDGSELLCSPEAGDWADMVPHRHHVLYVNVVYVLALRAVAALVGGSVGESYRATAERVKDRINQLLWIGDCTTPTAAARRIESLASTSHEWGLTGQYATRYGSMPFYLPYAAFRAVGTHFDTVGNSLAIVAGIADAERAATTLDYADAVGIASPGPSKTLDPPILPGDEDWRDYFRWRNLCLPHHYQNGGSWPFAGALHIAALVKIGRLERARVLLDKLAEVCIEGTKPFPEWIHGITGAAMGEPSQLWSATGLLWAMRAVDTGDVPLLEALS